MQATTTSGFSGADHPLAGALQDRDGASNSLPDTMNRQQLLFGINQGGVVDEIRMEHAKPIREMDLDGYAVGGLAVGESHEEMYHILDVTVPCLPRTSLI